MSQHFNIVKILKISRPRFWLYEAATFGLIGAVAGAGDYSFFTNISYWIFFLYFLIPANILIYGINDIFDYDTDRNNPKKIKYESLVTPDKRKSLWWWIALTNIPFLFFIPFTTPLLISFGVFLLCAVFYSTLPIRAKRLPILDSLFSAGHYIATGVFGYYLTGGISFPTLGIVAGMLWAIAMHAYSAVPDISSDKQAGLRTIAILMGPRKTILLCWVLYITAALLVLCVIPIAAVMGMIVFSYLMWRSLKKNISDEKLFALYKTFPLINACIGALISITLLASLL